jgi:hypothetical protein
MTERFTLLSELGRGGMGVVWKARDEETGQIVALKVMREMYAEDADYVARFERELELAKRINSAHVVKVLGFGVRQKMPYLALEFIDGPSLHEALVKHGPYSWAEARVLMAQLAQGLADAHAAGVIHRDVKPSNVLIGPDGVAKLTDFGIARGLDSTRMTATSTMIGTPAYLAPEGPKDGRSDLYSLGIIGYQLLAGAPPFVGQTYQEVLLAHLRDEPDLSRLPAETRQIIAWLLAKDPAKRARNAWEVIPVVEGRLFLTAPVAPSRVQSAPAPEYIRPSAPPQPSVRVETARSQAGRAPSAGAWRVLTEEKKGTRSIDPRVWHTATALPGGVVLFAGGGDGRAALASAEIFRSDAVSDLAAIRRVRAMRSTRLDHAATILADGRVLVCGGEQRGDEAVIDSAELFDLRTGAFEATGSMNSRRQLHTASLLPGGMVLVAGGWDGERSLASAEGYEPASGRFVRLGSMLQPRESHTATMLGDGKILLVGGDSKGRPIGTADLFDPATAAFMRVGSMETPRGGHAAALLPDGSVLIVGGRSSDRLSSAECFDTRAASFVSVSPMRIGREGHTATLTVHGLVLVVGGANDTGTLTSIEAFDPVTRTFTDVGQLKTGRVDHTATLLPDGRVLVAGGLGRNGMPLDSIELLSLEYTA